MITPEQAKAIIAAGEYDYSAKRDIQLVRIPIPDFLGIIEQDKSKNTGELHQMMKEKAIYYGCSSRHNYMRLVRSELDKIILEDNHGLNR